MSTFIKKVEYLVTGAFGLSQEGEIRIAYVIAGGDDTCNVLLYHPKSGRQTNGSLEMAKKRDACKIVNGGYQSIDGTENEYCNLSPREERYYRRMVQEALGESIPRKLVVSEAPRDPDIEEETPRARRRGMA